MSHFPIQLSNISLAYPQKSCFENFTTQIYYGSRIAIIGCNGSGKSSLLKIIQNLQLCSEGRIVIPDNVKFGYIPQIIEDNNNLSGGQRLIELVITVLKQNPNFLILDEPTNHLDSRNRKFLIKILNNFSGTVIVASHDLELLDNCTIIWHIDNDGKIKISSGSYKDHIREIEIKRTTIVEELSRLKTAITDTHLALMKEQKRAKNSQLQGRKNTKQQKWPTMISDAKARKASETSGKKKRDISGKKQELTQRLSELRLPEVIIPKFTLIPNSNSIKTIISINEGSIKYNHQLSILKNINFSMVSNAKIAIKGDNGSGKTSLIRAILEDKSLIRVGEWYTPKKQDIGYLDQHYSNINKEISVFDTIANVVPSWSKIEIRTHLNDFLFRKNEEVLIPTNNLSGGERARLSLAMIAAIPPKLLILDEITNNIDLETKEHVQQILKYYQGALIIISHDEEFLSSLEISETWHIKNQELLRQN